MMKMKAILLTLILLLSITTVVFDGEDPTPPPPTETPPTPTPPTPTPPTPTPPTPTPPTPTPPTPTPPPPPDEGDEWCSPGYWRNHLDSWTEHDVLFSEVIGEIKLSKLGVKMGKTANPTLLQVLQGPQFYTGDAFNEVGDYLSAIYVNFTGIRVPDSCPLN